MQLFSPDKLKHQLAAWPTPGCYWVGYSGGADSTALLHAMAQIRAGLNSEVRALHINHGLHANANAWQAHCEEQCKDLDIKLICETVRVDLKPRHSPEAQARNARYAAMLAHLQDGDMLLTAHHADDQAETVILNLMRGAGVDGLAAIEPLRKNRSSWLARPLLDWRREQLGTFLANQNIPFIDDPSNSDQLIRRNFVRHEILPRLTSVWPAATQQLNKTAELARGAASILKSLAEADLAPCLGSWNYAIRIERLCEFELQRQALIIRLWAQSNALPCPEQNQLNELLRQIHQARDGSDLCVKWRGAEVRRYRDNLLIMPSLPDSPEHWQLDWNGHDPAELPPGIGTVILLGNAATIFDDRILQLHFRSGSERLRPVGQKHHRSLKHLFQTEGIPPWLRKRVPLISLDGRCVAVGDLWLDGRFAELLSESGLRLVWEPELGHWRDIRKDMLATQ